MLLFPQCSLVHLKAPVVRAIPTKHERISIALYFPDAEPRQRDILVAHALRKESKQLRARRES